MTEEFLFPERGTLVVGYLQDSLGQGREVRKDIEHFLGDDTWLASLLHADLYFLRVFKAGLNQFHRLLLATLVNCRGEDA